VIEEETLTTKLEELDPSGSESGLKTNDTHPRGNAASPPETGSVFEPEPYTDQLSFSKALP
jgi:hypothetical protein